MSPKAVILIVDDEPLLLFDIEDTLTQIGHEVLTASNSEEAIKLLDSRDDVSVVITDKKMPGSMDGVGLRNTIHGRWPAMKVIIMTGDAGDPDIPDGVHIIAKPFREEDILRAVQHP